MCFELLFKGRLHQTFTVPELTLRFFIVNDRYFLMHRECKPVSDRGSRKRVFHRFAAQKLKARLLLRPLKPSSVGLSLIYKGVTLNSKVSELPPPVCSILKVNNLSLKIKDKVYSVM